MPDYIYLLENRLSADQQQALRHLREIAREAGTLLFLAGSAVRDLTSGHAVREMEIVLHSNALKLKRPIEKAGGTIWGEDDASRTLYLCFPGTVRVDLATAHRVEYPKPAKPVYHWASIQEDLRRRDFTVNAMAISLNEGSYGLLMDPLNGAADIEARTLRLVSNYGFLDQPALMLRATRLHALLGWELDPRSQTRYGNAREEGVLSALSSLERSRELEQIGHEDDGLKVLEAMEAEGWMKVLFPAWTRAKADEEKLRTLHELCVELLLQGVRADISAAQMQLLTAKLAAKDLASLKKHMLRPGFVAEWNSLDSIAAAFQKVLLAKENQKPSAAFKLFTSYDPEAVLWLGFSAKSEAVRERYRLFLHEWPEARQRIPHAQMLEMRIKPELANYNEILHAIFLELIDGKLTTPEEIRAFLEPYSPPAPPPQVTIKRTRARRNAEARAKERSLEEDEESESGDDEDLDDVGSGDEDGFTEMEIPKGAMGHEPDEEAEDDEEEAEASTLKRGKKSSKVETARAKTSPAKAHPEPHSAKKSAPEKPKETAKAPAAAKHAAEKEKAAPQKAKHAAEKAKPTPAKAGPAKAKPAPAPKKAAKATPTKKAIAKAARPARPTKPSPKKPARPAAKPAAKSKAKSAVKAHPAKKTAAKPAKPSKPAPKKPAKPVARPAAKKAAKKTHSKPARKR